MDRILDSDDNLVQKVEPSVYNQIDLPQEVWAAVKEGMRGVVSPEDHGTAADKFSTEFKDKYLDRLAGKTGTAQVGSGTQIDIENTSWFVTFAPRDNPQIAVVICVPYGFSGSSSASAVEDIMTYYFEKQENAAPENLVGINGLVP